MIAQQHQLKEVSSFLSNYRIVVIDQQTKVVHSSSNSYLVKNIRLQNDSNDLDNIIETLEQHQTLNQQYLLTLLEYQVIQKHEQSATYIRTIYQYANLTLKEEIENRKHKLVYFDTNELWTIIYTITRALEYLEKLNIGYGVLGCDKIFIGQKIKLLDPSAVAQDPLAISKQRLYSPQILLDYESINILKSDVYVFGLCIIQAALLVNLTNEAKPEYDETRNIIYLDEIESTYGNELSCLIRQMLQFNSQQRPSYSQIRQYLQKTLEISEPISVDYFCPLADDIEDEINQNIVLDQTNQFESIDVEQQQESLYQSRSLNEYQKARMKFLSESGHTIKSLSRIQESNMSNQLLNISNKLGQKRKTTKNIKEKVVKNIGIDDLQIIEIKAYNKHQNLFTHPKLMEDIQNQLKLIEKKHKSQIGSKENIYRNMNY